MTTNYYDELTPAQREEYDKMESAATEVKRNKEIGDAQRAFNPDYLSKFKFDNPKDNGNIVKTITEDILNRYRFVTIEESREILVYDVGVYVNRGEVVIEKTAESLHDYEVTNKHIIEIKGHIMRQTYHSITEFDDDANIINLKNGLYNIETGEFKEHTPKYLSFSQFPVRYDPNASWVPILNFFKQIQNREGVRTLIKMFGYILMKSTKYQKAFFFAGKGDNGKSVLTDLTEEFVGEDNCSSVKLHDLKDDKFMRAQIFRKVVNTYADTPATSLQDVGIFKALVTGDKLEAQYKYGKLFAFRNRAKLIFSGNSIPLSEGEDELAYFKRWVILRFNSLFIGNKQDKGLLKKLTTPENLSGLFNLALVGLKLLEREGFQSVPIQEIREEYDRQYISHKRFIEERCSINHNNKEFYIKKDDYYASYLKYYQENGEDDEPLTEDQIEIELSKLGIYAKRKKFDGVKFDCWVGIITREEADRRNQEILERQKQDTLE